MSEPASSRRLRWFFITTFVITWSTWWALSVLASRGVVGYGQPLFMTIFLLGGFGPTIGAYVATYATRRDAPVREFNGRLFRWRVGIVWYLVAFGLPFLLGLVSTTLGTILEPGFADHVTILPWTRVVPLFLMMIIGGGVEELGWRGVAQPELERRVSRPAAAVIVGVVWALWHLPLFSIVGVGQYGTSFPIFFVEVVGLAFILAWLYAHTGSILLCVIFHASFNAAAAMGLLVPSNHAGPAVADAVFKVLVGVVLVLAIGPTRPTSTPGPTA